MLATQAPSRSTDSGKALVKHRIEIVIGKKGEYVKDLKKRMDALHISQGELARTMKLSPTQVSRWFTDNEARLVRPSIETAYDIETALLKIQEKRKKEQDAQS